MPAPPADTYALGERRYLREKVVSIYESIWDHNEAVDWTNLFNLKVNAAWLQEHIAAAPAVELLSTRKPAVRRLFNECLVRIPEGSHSIDVRCHALETLSGVFLGIGCHNFHDPVAEVLELLCGIDRADERFAELFSHIKCIISSDKRGVNADAIRRCAIRLLLSLTAAAADLHRNVLVDLLMPHGFEQPSEDASLLLPAPRATPLPSLLPSLRPSHSLLTTPSPSPTCLNLIACSLLAAALYAVLELLRRSGDNDDGSAVSADGSVRASEVEDVSFLLVLLAAYRRHESPNGFLRLLSDTSPDSPYLQSLAQTCLRVLERCMYPTVETNAASTYLGASWRHSIARYAEWAAHALTIESYLPNVITSQLSSPEALRANAAPLSVALLVAHELAVPHGGATLAALCATRTESSLAGVSGQGCRGALLRNVFSVASLLACDASDELIVAQLRLALCVVERALEGSRSAPLILSVDLGGRLALWSYSKGSAVETALPSPQPLLAGGYTLLANLLTQNLRRATFHSPLYLQALSVLHKLFVAQHRAGQTLPLLRWSMVWEALLTLSEFITGSGDEFFSGPSVAEVGLRVLELINLLIALGDTLLPSAAVFESFAYELVRRHATIDKLYRMTKRAAPRAVDAMARARSMIAAALDSMSRMDSTAARNLTAAQAIDVIRGLPVTKPDVNLASLRSPSLMSPHEQLALSHSLLRVLLAHCRQGGSLRPLHYEDLAVRGVSAG